MSESSVNAKPKKKFKEWFKELKAEFNKIIWPDQGSVVRQTVAVTVITIILGIIIVLVDAIVQFGLDKLFAL